MSTIDTEILDLLRDRPDLLRLATAVAEAGRPPRRILRVSVAATVTAIAAAVALVTAWPNGGPNVVDRALAALSTGPVIHAVVERSSPNNLVVDLATGDARERIHTIEYWYDRERSALHTRLLTDGKMLTEIVETPTGSDSDLGHYPGGIAAQLDPALAGFVTQYREALADGTAKIVGHNGDVTLIRFSTGYGGTEDVGVDGASYRPLFFTYNHEGQPGQRWRVATIDSIARDPADFAKPELSAPRPTGAGGNRTEPIEPAQAANALGRPPVWLGETFRDLPLTGVALATDETTYTDGTKTPGRWLVLTYGKTDAIVIGEAASVAGSYQLGFNDGGDPPAPEGSIVLEGDQRIVVPPGSAPPPVEWSGRLIRKGLYIEIRASSRQLVLGVARALRDLS
ncbi:MAG TPA: hypothetical protein VF891_01295 [Gaiellaceae bacterium]